MGLHKILKIVAAILGVLGIVYAIRLWFAGEGASEAMIGQYLMIAYVIMGIVLLFVVIFVLKGIAAGDIKKTLITIGVFAAIVLISYLMANGVETELKDGKMLSASGSKWIGAGLYAFYFLAIVAIGSMIYSGIKKLAN